MHLDKKSPPTFTLRHDQINLTSRYTDPDKKSLQVHRQYHDNTILKTISRPQSTTLERDMLDYTKIYHTDKKERCNVDGNSEENRDASEHISDRFQETALFGKK